jgi:hypothetical protein
MGNVSRIVHTVVVLAYFCGVSYLWILSVIVDPNFPNVSGSVVVLVVLVLLGCTWACYRRLRKQVVLVSRDRGVSALAPLRMALLGAASAGGNSGGVLLVGYTRLHVLRSGLGRTLGQDLEVLGAAALFMALILASLCLSRHQMRRFRHNARIQAGYCGECGYSLQGISSHRCPECGASREDQS